MNNKIFNLVLLKNLTDNSEVFFYAVILVESAVVGIIFQSCHYSVIDID